MFPGITVLGRLGEEFNLDRILKKLLAATQITTKGNGNFLMHLKLLNLLEFNNNFPAKTLFCKNDLPIIWQNG
ncbi:hypothetical protein KKC1_15680 [Calderihabitans maritimus]|uniref:Uncharacterized protein n=1 Tax=Calderihabitans maritimus TaxID=1246530 RepID=A0A1Z5HSB9_9FIRM|nr:hypothetical protein KKC1_15680 [Calderihabitans maritimus]